MSKKKMPGKSENPLIPSWANIMTQKSTKVPGPRSLHLEEHCSKIEDDVSLIFTHSFFSPTNLISKFNLVLI